MKIFIVGSGKLANSLLNADWKSQSYEVVKWDSLFQGQKEKGIVIHAGSGRQFQDCVTFCSLTKSVLIELSTGLKSEEEYDFPYILCPNTSILVGKALNMINEYGKHFEKYDISILESHQMAKTTEAGTAFAFAHSLNFPVDEILSIRSPEFQKNQIGIPAEFIPKHAYHKIIIRDGDNELRIETKVLGHQSYVNGVKTIIEAVLKYDLECKRFSIFDLLDKYIP